MLNPQEIAVAVSSIIKQVPALLRWRKLDAEKKQAVVQVLGDALAQLALDILD